MQLLVILFLFLYQISAWALDTTEVFASGFSDVEVYGSQSSSERTMSFVTGYGYSRWLNPSVSFTQSFRREEGENQNEGQFGLCNFANIFSGIFEVDLLTGIHKGPESMVGFLGDEWTVPLGRTVPYFKNLIEIEESQTLHALSAGVSFQNSKSLELFAESGWDLIHSQHSFVAIGMNILQSEAIEILTEAGVHSASSESYASLGIIWTLE
ncbi:MAG: hypothetical protein OM95_16690 [Bdellovibrio sp. ArHS]|uniref:hypothetical protein n=1 Tax=Bdellovibrio sp. ArHS TaxID=1569284 RepID=UPI0005834830|nr:hypothetical protein [Bdellovibrio sp. ArHS]KHD87018.1 MAG: hypothetical protein OM95_16690 [Bdellovibrio sp. ArHS]